MNLIDRLVATINPTAGLARAQARKALALIERSYQGAEPSRISSNRAPKNQPADQELLGPFGADRLRAWGRDLVRNNAYAWGVVDTIVSSVVGCGIKVQSISENQAGEDLEDLNDARDKVWSEWAEVCDINGQLTFDEIQALAQREIVEAGEVLIRLVRLPSQTYRGIYRPVPLALEVIEADRLATDYDTYQMNINREGGDKIVRGVKLDDLGKPIAYLIYKDHPNAPYAVSRTPEEIPASEILHLFRKDRVGQTRGVSWFAPALSWIRDLGTYVDNELAASAVAACFGVAIKTETPLGDLADPDGQKNYDSSGNRVRSLEPGMVLELAPGESVEGINPNRPNTASEAWIRLILRGIAVGTGLSYETVARDYSSTSYSSSRTSQLEDRRRFRCWQQYLIHHLLQPVWDAFCDQAALSSVSVFPTSAELLSDRRGSCPVEFLTPDWEWVDPQTEQATAEMALKSFTDTYANVLGSRGKSFRQVFYQRAKEDRLRKQLGLLTPMERQLDISAAQSAMPVEQPAEPETLAQPIARNWVTTEDDNRLFIEDGELKTSPGGKSLAAARPASPPKQNQSDSKQESTKQPGLRGEVNVSDNDLENMFEDAFYTSASTDELTFTRDTIDEFVKGLQNYESFKKPEISEHNGYKTLEVMEVKVAKGKPRQNLRVIDFGTVRVVLQR